MLHTVYMIRTQMYLMHTYKHNCGQSDRMQNQFLWSSIRVSLASYITTQQK